MSTTMIPKYFFFFFGVLMHLRHAALKCSVFQSLDSFCFEFRPCLHFVMLLISLYQHLVFLFLWTANAVVDSKHLRAIAPCTFCSAVQINDHKIPQFCTGFLLNLEFILRSPNLFMFLKTLY